MTLAAGTRLGPYEVASPLGAGGMGEVYRAKDTRLDREVAIKVLPEHLSANAELRQRFEREAKAISALTHPHICTLHDVGNQDGVEYLVMELLDGQSLSERLESGALPPDQVIRFGIEIADALEAAHRQGIVHRDLKPGNVMLTRSGVKLLDFGLAKHRAAAVQSEISHLSSMATELTPSRPALTEQGTIMGTFQYMAPEQLEGKEADARSDIFAFGCVLYEMATGRKAFTGKSRASMIGAILKDHPAPISSITPMTPPALDRLVQTCLAKEPDDRFQTAHDVKLQLQWIAEGGSQAGAPAVVVSRRKTREKLAWGLSGLLFAAAALLAVGYLRRAPAPASPVRFQLVLPDALSVVEAPRISPDGKLLAFSARNADGKAQIWMRPLEALDPRPVPGTDGASFRPIWAPDSRHIAFVAEGKLKKVDIAGAPPQTICDATTGADGSWGKDGTILFDGQTSDPIRRVSAGGGTPQTAVKAEGSSSVGWPDFLPDGKHFLYFEFGGGGTGQGRVMAASLDPQEKPRKILDSDSLAQYAPPGRLLYVKEGTLVAQAFDASALKLTGEPVPIAEQMGATGNGLADFSVSANGALVYRGGVSNETRLVWVDRSGKETSELEKAAGYGSSAISPDGTRLAMDVSDSRSDKRDIWIRDLVRGVTSRFTFDPANEVAPVWSPDGNRLVYSSDRKGPPSLYQKDASGTGPETELWSCGDSLIANDWSSDGKFILVNRLTAKNSWDIWVYPTDRTNKPFPFVEGAFTEVLPTFSPDVRYVTYMSNESGRFEIYVQQFPGPGGKWQVSGAGGTEPHWSADGKTIYFRGLDSKMMAAAIDAGATFTAGVPQALFDARVQPGQRRNAYAVTRDGQKFLLLSPLGKEKIAPITVVLNWPEALHQ
ncbi:MAG TPA: protein kinase [Thermoanaerobaculia bacterium]|nr:protein kinase [Thermoanaerobaculia bacterium]